MLPIGYSPLVAIHHFGSSIAGFGAPVSATHISIVDPAIAIETITGYIAALVATKGLYPIGSITPIFAVYLRPVNSQFVIPEFSTARS